MPPIAAKRKTDIGPPHYRKFLPPIIQRNYGKWVRHEIPKPGVLIHTSLSGEKLYTVRAGSPRLLSTKTLRLFAALADEFSDGFMRFTSRNNVEFLLSDSHKVDPLIERLQAAGYPVGGTGPAITTRQPRTLRAWSSR
jgi:sulfite reductase beta subunit